MRLRSKDVRIRMDTEMHGQWVGPMPLDQFFAEFLPLSENDEKSFPGASINKSMFEGVSQMKTEKEMYRAVLAVVEKNKLLPGYKLVNTSTKRDPHGDQPWHIDLTCYKNEVAIPPGRHNQLAKAEFGIELKSKESDAPFGSPKERFIPTSTGSRTTRGQLAMYASQSFSHQHRTHLLSVFMSKTKACFLYYDRSGVVVSEYFRYTTDAEPLVKFLWYFTHLTDEQRGHDTTVRIAPESDANLYWEKLFNFHRRVVMTELRSDVLEILQRAKKELAIKVARSSAGGVAQTEVATEVRETTKEDLTDDDWDLVWDETQGRVEALFTENELTGMVNEIASERMPSATREAVIIEVPNGKNSVREVIGKGFRSRPESLTGRATRAWPVMDMVTKKLLYLKDSWRPCIASMSEETVILKMLNDNEVPYIPRLECGGDVGTQETRANTFADEDWVFGKPLKFMTPRTHHRFLVDFIGRPLKHFTRSRQMLQATYDAFIGHRVAWERCGILHRDISGNNVMLDRWGRGVLNDWDLAKTKEEMNKGPRAAARTGTWYFISTLLLQYPGRRHDVQDDLESFFWLVLFHCLCYLRHSRLANLGKLIYDLFEECTDEDGHCVGGGEKMLIFTTTKFINSLKLDNCTPLQDWIKEARIVVKEWVTANIPPDNLKDLGEKAKARVAAKMSKPVIDMSTLDLYNHDYLASLFEEALSSTDWPTGIDKTENPLTGIDLIYFQVSASSSKRIQPMAEISDSEERKSKRIKASASSGMMGPVPEDVEDGDHD